MKLNDEVIAHIAKQLQLAILTGTDIVDNLRTARFVNNSGQIDISPDYQETFESNIQRMIEEATEAQATEGTTEEE